MFKQFLTASALAVAFTVAFGAGSSIAQTNAAPRAATGEEIRLAVVRNVGSQDQGVELSRTGNVIVVSRVNSNMNGAPHQLIANEAVSVAAVVSKAIADNVEFKDIHTIRVRYLDRSGSPSKDKTVDSVEFRKAPNGEFEIHVS
jgi:hypothetical protein